MPRSVIVGGARTPIGKLSGGVEGVQSRRTGRHRARAGYRLGNAEVVDSMMHDGLFEDEIVAVPVPQRKGDPVMVTEDEGVRPETTAESLAKLRPAFAPAGLHLANELKRRGGGVGAAGLCGGGGQGDALIIRVQA
jgi:acetyl-CoA acetyltransferase